MKASELRIGNFVRNNMNGEILIPCDILCDGINTENFEGLNYGFIEPIPLTEEWLLKFGFEITGNFQTKDRFQTHKQDGIIWFEHGYIVVELQYVHQLQNLYFALTGEELTFKSE